MGSWFFTKQTGEGGVSEKRRNTLHWCSHRGWLAASSLEETLPSQCSSSWRVLGVLSMWFLGLRTGLLGSCWTPRIPSRRCWQTWTEAAEKSCQERLGFALSAVVQSSIQTKLASCTALSKHSPRIGLRAVSDSQDMSGSAYLLGRRWPLNRSSWSKKKKPRPKFKTAGDQVRRTVPHQSKYLCHCKSRNRVLGKCWTTW